MNRHPIGYVGILFAIILIFAGVYAEGYSTREYIGISPFGYWRTKYPYKQYSFPLVLCGILSLIVGVVGLSYKRLEVG